MSALGQKPTSGVIIEFVRLVPEADTAKCGALVRKPGYRELRVALRPVLDAVRRCLVEVPRPLRIGFLAAIFLVCRTAAL